MPVFKTKLKLKQKWLFLIPSSNSSKNGCFWDLPETPAKGAFKEGSPWPGVHWHRNVKGKVKKKKQSWKRIGPWSGVHSHGEMQGKASEHTQKKWFLKMDCLLLRVPLNQHFTTSCMCAHAQKHTRVCRYATYYSGLEIHHTVHWSWDQYIMKSTSPSILLVPK